MKYNGSGSSGSGSVGGGGSDNNDNNKISSIENGYFTQYFLHTYNKCNNEIVLLENTLSSLLTLLS